MQLCHRFGCVLFSKFYKLLHCGCPGLPLNEESLPVDVQTS